MRRILPLSRIHGSLSTIQGLTTVEAKQLRIQYGQNDIIEVSTNRWLKLAKDTILDPMIWFLVGTSILFAILGNYYQTLILLLATIPLLGMDAFLHWRTQASTQSLSSQLAVAATVIRDGRPIKIPSVEIVPGDLIIMNPGEFFPADGIIVGGTHLQVEESALTGESLPITKQILTKLVATEQDSIAIDYDHWGFAGTRLLTGQALLHVIYSGKETLYGEIVSSAVKTTQAHTPLQKAIADLVLLLIVIATVICIILAAVRYYQGYGFIDAILSAAILAVAALPDEFPVVFTFFLGVGVYRLAQKKALVRRAVSVENIGRVTCICSDKTGTITEGRLQLVQILPAKGFDKKELLTIAAIASNTKSGDPLDLAVHKQINKEGVTIPNALTTFPFTEDRKRETAIISQNANKYLIATKGAPETILALTNLAEGPKQEYLDQIQQLAKEGCKIIACARLIQQSRTHSEPIEDYEFAGLLAFRDPPRKEVYAAIQNCRQCNIKVLMITGDHPETARAISRQIGLGADAPIVMLANAVEIELKKCGPEVLKNIDVIARAIPSQKLKFVQALQTIGNIVAVTGDGVNDVPALKTADIGIAMGGRGTQSAREVAAIVLLDDNFDSIVNAISEGRQLFKNLKLSFKYLLMVHIPFVFSAAIIPLFGYPLLYYPIHIVWIELLIHPTCMLVFQELPASKKLEPAKPRSKIHFFYFRDWLGIVAIGIYTTLLVTLSYTLILKNGGNIEYARGLALAMLGFTSAALTLGLSGFRNLTSKIVTIATLTSTILLIQIPLFEQLLGLKSLSLKDWLVVSTSSVIITILTKI